MELVKVNRLDAQRPERGLELSLHAGDGEIVVAVHEAVEVMAEFGGDEPARAVAARQIIADEFFGQVMRPVTFGGVNEVDAAVRRRVENGIGLGLRKIFPPLAAELPGADADDRNAQTGAPQNSVSHLST